MNLDLKTGYIIDNDKLCRIFQCSPQGGMRRGTRTNSLVIVSNHVESIYSDKWVDSILHYTGMGSKGNQDINFMQNKTLAESKTNGVDVYLFEVFKKKEYTYTGKVELYTEPYQETQLDSNNNPRKVWMFPLKVINDEPLFIEKDKLEELIATREKEARKLSDSDLYNRALGSKTKPSERNITSKSFERNPWVSEYTKRKANGICQLCNNSAPFIKNDGTPYLETHHVVWLSKGGEDSIENTVALCPNCHRKMHVLNDECDLEMLKEDNREI